MCEEEHEKHLQMVIKVLREHKLYYELNNCIFYQNNIHYLGNIISANGIAVQPEKIEAIRGWPMPINVIEVRWFVALVGCYRIFIKGFSKIARPITSLQNKGGKFEWTPKCDESFQLLKDILTSATILNISDMEEDFVVFTNACKEGLDGDLSQKDHVIFYESWKLKEHERNYATHHLELETIIHALKMWRHCLMGRDMR
jgi:hypothetical protein